MINGFPFQRVIRPAKGFAERCHAAGIVYNRYRDSKFIRRNCSGLHFSLLDLLPTTECWVYVVEGVVIGTMSAVLHASAGIPSGPVFELDLREIGLDGRVISEFTKCASDMTYDRPQTVAVEIMGTMIAAAWKNGIDDVICVVHPDHGRIWASIFGWKVLSEIKGHSGVNGNPGVLLSLDLKNSPDPFKTMPTRGRRIIDRALESEHLTSRTYRASGSEIVALLLQHPTLLFSSPYHHRVTFEKHYPWATTLLQPLLLATSSGSSNIVKLSVRIPRQERSFKSAGQVLKEKQSRLVKDQLIEPDAPLLLIIDNRIIYDQYAPKISEHTNFIPIQASSISDALNILQSSIFDFVFITGRVDEEEVEKLVKAIRKQDLNRGIHTPILDLNIILQNRPPLLLGYSGQEIFDTEVNCIIEICKTLQIVGNIKLENDILPLAVRA